MADESSVNPREFKSLLNTLGSRLIAISFWDDQDTQALAESFGAVTMLDKLTLATELIPAIKSATSKQRSASRVFRPALKDLVSHQNSIMAASFFLAARSRRILSR
jgi:hypothetical protein